MIISEILKQLLFEQDSKLMTLRKAIGERIPVTIFYSGPPEEVKSGQRIDIEPIVLGKNRKSGNLVIWAYVFNGVSKKGLPGWKMFRVDRIQSIDYNLNAEKFKLGSLPGYQKGKAPNAMKSLSSVEIFSPYWFEDDERFKKQPEVKPTPSTPIQNVPPEPVSSEPVSPEPVSPEVIPNETPEISNNEFSNQVYNNIKNKVKDVNGQKVLTTRDYEMALKDLYYKKEGEWKTYQRQLSGNERPGEGTRKRFTNTSKNEMDNLLAKNGIKVSDDNNMLSESRKRFLRLIN